MDWIDSIQKMTPSDLGAHPNMKWMADQRDTSMKFMQMIKPLSLHQL